MRARRLLRQLHGWLGALSALFVVLVAGSGAALAFMPEMFKWQYGAMLEAEAPSGTPYADLDRIAEAARTGYGKPIELVGVLMPDSRVQGVAAAIPYGVPVGGTPEDTTMLAVDPYTATYQGAFVLDDALGHELTHFHYQLFAGEIGATIVAVLGLLLVAFALTGLWLWWPRDGKVWRKAKRLDISGGPKRALFALHGWSGVWAALLIGFFALTGTATAKPDWFAPMLRGAPEGPPPGAGFDRACAGQVSLGQAVRTAEAAHPGARLAMASFYEPGAPYTLSFKRGGDLDRIGGDLVVFAHRSCPGLIHSVDLTRAPLAERAGAMMFSLHGGYSFGRLLGGLLVIVTGLALVLSALSGVYVFVTRTLRIGRAQRAPASRAPLPAE